MIEIVLHQMAEILTLANAIAIAFPILLLAPVTMAFFPCNLTANSFIIATLNLLLFSLKRHFPYSGLVWVQKVRHAPHHPHKEDGLFLLG